MQHNYLQVLKPLRLLLEGAVVSQIVRFLNGRSWVGDGVGGHETDFSQHCSPVFTVRLVRLPVTALASTPGPLGTT